MPYLHLTSAIALTFGMAGSIMKWSSKNNPKSFIFTFGDSMEVGGMSLGAIAIFGSYVMMK